MNTVAAFFVSLSAYLANLRLSNEHQMLKPLELGCWGLAGFNTAHRNSDENGRVRLLNVVDQFLVAAKRFGISHLAFEEFSRQQSSLCLGDKTSNNATFYWLLPNDRSQRSSVILHLSSLNLDRSRLLQ